MKIKPRLFDQKDIQERVNWINNPSINSTMFFELPATVQNTQRWYENNRNSKQRIDFTFEEGSDIVAMGGFTGISSEHKNAEFYVMVNPEFQGKGIGKEVSRWMYNYAFSVLKLNKIYLYTNDDNIAAYKIYESAGFVLEGVMREHKWKSGAFQNRRFYGLLSKEWENLEWKQIIKDEL